MNFKKLFCGTLTVALMGAVLMGCGGGSSETGSTTTAATTAATAVPTATTAAGGDSAASGEVYTNNALGLKYTAPDGVTVAIQGEGSQYEMMATSSSGEILFVMNQNVGASVSEETFAELLKTQLSSQLTNPAYKDLTKTTVGGVEFTDLTYDFTQSGVNMSQVMLLKSDGNNIIVINVTYLNESGREKLLSGFSAL